MLSKLKSFLDDNVTIYNNNQFIINDPVSIPHKFSRKEDIEISGFLTALISWGNRPAILKSAQALMNMMGNQPYDFITSIEDNDLKPFTEFYYRTFNASDLLFLVEALKHIYVEKGGLEAVANHYYGQTGDIKGLITGLREELLNAPHLPRSEKHLANPAKGSAAKRINMFLRWMVRNDNKGVDFGLWRRIPASALMIPLDLHTGRVARQLGLLQRKQDDWKAVEELTAVLRKFDQEDPVKYDYALFGMGISGLSISIK
ncbi:MAG: TIGR02757 family protein [Bacteroidales bacterium]|nr:TIGR02757 family protein [Bacteroidales bacterium]